jgi:hypothetical protein
VKAAPTTPKQNPEKSTETKAARPARVKPATEKKQKTAETKEKTAEKKEKTEEQLAHERRIDDQLSAFSAAVDADDTRCRFDAVRINPTCVGRGCQIDCFQTKNPNLGKFRRTLEWKSLG